MIESIILEYFVNSLWQVPVLAGAAWLLIRASRPDLRLQHGIWLAVLAFAVLLPLRGISYRNNLSVTVAVPLNSSLDQSLAQSPSQFGAHLLPASAPQPLAGSELLPLHRVMVGPQAIRWMTGIYLANIILGFLRLMRRWLAARRLVRSADPLIASPQQRMQLDECCRVFGVARPPILVSAKVESPVVVGAVSPILLVTIDFSGYSEAEAKAALCHELVHVKRRDYLANFLCRLLALPIGYHPATSAIQRQIRQTREMICDDLAAREMASPREYAWSLVSLARRIVSTRGIADGVEAIGLFDNNQLEERVMRLINIEAKTTEAKTTEGQAAPGRTATPARLLRMLPATVLVIVALAGAATLHVTPTMAGPRMTGLPASPAAPGTHSRGALPIANPSSPMHDPTELAAQDSASPLPPVPPKPSAAPSAAPPVPPSAPVPPAISSDDLAPLAAPAPPLPQNSSASADVAPAAPPAPPAAPSAPADVAAPAPPVAPLAPALAPRLPALRTPRPLRAPRPRPLREKADRTMEDRGLNAAQRLDLEKQMSRIQAQVATQFSDDRMNKQLAEVMKQQAKAMAASGDALKLMNSPEFKKKMEGMQREMADAVAKLDSPELKKQLELSTKLSEDAVLNLLDSVHIDAQLKSVDGEMTGLNSKLAQLKDPKFRLSLEKALKMAAEADKLVDTPEFERQMEKAREQLESGDLKVNTEAADRAMHEAEERLKQLNPK